MFSHEQHRHICFLRMWFSVCWKAKLNMYKVLSFSSVFAADSHKWSWNLSTLSAQLMQCNFCPTLKCHLPRYCWHLFLLLSLCIERILLKPIFRELFTYSLPGHCLPYLIAIWCLLDVLWWSQCVFKVRRYCQSPWTFPGLWLAGVVTEDEKRWESHSKENLLPRKARHAFTMCQCSQPSCSLRVCGIVPPRHNEGTAFKFNFGGCHK